MARFDEQTNINWAAKLEEVGAHVSYGVVGHKTHAKMVLVLRREKGHIRRYGHLGTGNYHPKTARLYTAFGLLTAAQKMRSEEHTSELQSLMRISYAVICLQKEHHQKQQTKQKKCTQ